jgi:pseudouridine kinase
MGAGRVVLSMGAMGVCWCDAQGVAAHRGANPSEVVNTSGAGDALLSGLVHGHLRDMPLIESVKFAMACAELTLSSTFANTPFMSVTAAMQRMAISDSFNGSNL